jgi:hypothetical protein
LRKNTVIFTVAILLVVIILPFCLDIGTASAQAPGYTIQRVDHRVEVLYSGHIVIRDTIQIAGQFTGVFWIGFPKKYGSNVLKGMAYAANNTLPMSLGVPYEGQSGFYGANINFSQGSSQVFTVIFILSNDLVSYDSYSNVFSVDFPAYPSISKEAASVDVTLIFPDGATSVTITKDDGTVETNTYAKNNLAAFTYSPATANHTGALPIIDITKLDRMITISPAGDVVSSDSYRIINKSPSALSSLEISLPLAASDVVGRDEFGRTLVTEVLTSINIQVLNATFISTLNGGESTSVAIQYTLPIASPEQATHFVLDFDLFPNFDYYIDSASVTIIPPEGARFLTPQLSSIDPSLSLNREIFQETLSINRQGVSYLDFVYPSENVSQIAYDYNPLWLSFRPTVWVWALTVIGCIIVAFLRRPKAAAPLRIVVPKLTIGLSPDQVRTFTDAYEEKSRITSELKSLDTRAQKGKIPRRRYKVQRRTLEVRFEALSKEIAELKALFRSAGGNYAALIRQLDAAETELNETETSNRSVEAGYRRGELSLEEYKKSISDYQRRKEKAETTINGILLRLREEIH